MSDDTYLHRADAPFGNDVWAKLDETVVGVAKARLAGRRLLHVDGPHGLALQAFGSAERAAKDAVSTQVVVQTARMIPVPSIESPFSLSAREIAAFESTHQLFDTSAAARAAAACADQEDALVFNVDRVEGRVYFSSAEHGQAPQAGREIRVWYRRGGGAAGATQHKSNNPSRPSPLISTRRR